MSASTYFYYLTNIFVKKINEAYMMVGIIKINFVHLSIIYFVTLYKSLVRSHLEYANSVWYPKRKNTDVHKLERVRKGSLS